MRIDRRDFLRASGAGLTLLPSVLRAQPDAQTFYFGVIADTHIIDDFYRGPEGSPEDTASIFETSTRLTAARAALNALQPPLAFVMLVGDYFHDYPSADLEFYFQQTTRIDRAKAITDGFRMPVHVGLGNHDYAVPKVSRETTHELLRRKLSLRPYYAIDHRGFKFVHLNNFLGQTWQAGHERFDKRQGTLGEEQLLWLETQLREQRPTFLFVHYPLTVIAPKEVADFGLPLLLKRHRQTIQCVISGHWHRWFEFGRSFGPPHLVIAATRYDPDAYLIVEVDTRTATHRLLNLDRVDWNTHFSEPFTSPADAR